MLKRFKIGSLHELGRLPATLSLAAVSLFAAWMGFERGGYFVGAWTLPALALALLLLVGLATGAFRKGARFHLGTLALVCFGLYTLWTFASILWSPNRGEAWQGAALTLMYLLVAWTGVALLAVGASRRWVLAVAATGPAVVAAYTLLSLGPNLNSYFEGGRLNGTVGYYNGEAAFLLVPFWTAIYLGGSRRVSPVLRSLVLAGAVLCSSVAVLTQSRGAMVAMATSLVVFFLLGGQRVRGLIALAPVATTLAISFPGLNEVYLALSNGQDAAAAIRRVVPTLWLGAAGAGLYGLLWALLDRWWRPSASLVRVAGGASVAVVLVACALGAFAVVERGGGEPLALAQQKWREFKTDDVSGAEQSRYLSASGQGRYSLWQIAWEDFTDHPVLGVGTHNYEATYYQRRDQTKTGSVRQPHSLPLEVLAERGIVGGALFAGFLGLCVTAGLGERFGRLSSEGRAQVGALSAAVTYWFVHASADWFWQIPAVTLPAALYLSMLAAPWLRSRTSPLGWQLRLAGACAVALAVAAVAPLYLADRYLVATYSATEPSGAFAAVERAQSLNPLDPLLSRREAELAILTGDRERAVAALQRTIELDPENYAPYALLAELFQRTGAPGRALPLYQKALGLNPASAALNRQTIELVTSVLPEGTHVRFVDGGSGGTALQLQVVQDPPEKRGASADATLETPDVPAEVDGVLYAWPKGVKASFSGRKNRDPLRIVFVNGNGTVLSSKRTPVSGAGTAEPPGSYRMAAVLRERSLGGRDLRPGGRVVFASLP